MPGFLYLVPPLLLAAYYAVLIATKLRVPNPGPVVVRYEPPADLTPAAARYIWKGCVDQRTVACVFAGLATKGRIALERNSHAYRVTKTALPPAAPALNPEEQSTMEWLFSNFLEHATFSPQSANGCISSLRRLLDRRLRGQYQAARSGWAVLGMALSLAVSILVASQIHDRSGNALKFAAVLFMICFMTGVITAALLVPAVNDLLRGMGSIGRLALAIAITGLSLSGVVGIFLQVVRFAPVELGIMICLLVAMNIAAVPILRRITPKGIEAQRQIERFREYLLKVEQDLLDRMVKANTAPPPSASLLSYAIALEVKDAWGDELTNACFGG
ncbi:MAG: DUF2207 family protein [Terriglobales bacterium]